MTIGDPELFDMRSLASDWRSALCFAFLSDDIRSEPLPVDIDELVAGGEASARGDKGDVGSFEEAAFALAIDNRLGDCDIDCPRERRRALVTDAGAK